MTTKPQKLKANPDWQALIVGYVRETGLLDGCTKILPQYHGKDALSLQAVKNALTETIPGEGGRVPNSVYLPEFAARIKKARDDYKIMHTHPSDDPEFRRDVYDQVKKAAKAGHSNRQAIEYNADGKVVARTYTKPGVDKWLFDVAFPKQEFTEEAILVVLANMFQDLGESQSVTGATRETILTYLADWKRRALEELHVKGLKTKYLEPDTPDSEAE